MKRLFKLMLAVVLVAGIFGWLAAAPHQAERPPQPFFQDFFSGAVRVQGQVPPDGSFLIACIDDCGSGFESEPYRLKTDGSFDQLEVNPNNEDLVGHLITFYLVNDFGRIQAVETRPYIGVFDFYVQDLTFVDGIPVAKPTAVPATPKPTGKPTPVAALPVAGEPVVAHVPRITITAGLIVAFTGAGLMMVARRRMT